jgi:hypothetical protein
MINGLIILNSSHPGSRDLYWNDDPDPKTSGYNVYRSEDYQHNWVRINRHPVPGTRYRDQAELEVVTREFNLSSEWVEKGEFGSWRLRAQGETLWADPVNGIPSVANAPQDVLLYVNGVATQPARVIGLEGEVWLPRENYLEGSNPTRMSRLDPTKITSVSMVYKRLVNSVNLFLATQTFYTVVPVDSVGNELHPVGALGSEVRSIMDVDSMDYMQREMVRRNAWIFEQVGEPSWLLIRKTKGEVCGCVNPETGEAKTACPACFEIGIVGGYYGPLDILFIDPDQGLLRTTEEGGVKVERTSRSYLGPSPIVKNGDIIVRKNGERLVIGNLTYKSPRGVLLQQEFDCILLPPGSTKYLIPLQEYPSIYNPAFAPAVPFVEGEPASDPLTDPTKNWDNQEQRPLGRTTTFGRIMT